MMSKLELDTKMSKSSSRSSTSSSARRNAEAEKAALLVQAEGLRKAQALEREEAKLVKLNAKLKAKREMLAIETQLAAAEAKLKTYELMSVSEGSNKSRHRKDTESHDDDYDKFNNGLDDVEDYDRHIKNERDDDDDDGEYGMDNEEDDEEEEQSENIVGRPPPATYFGRTSPQALLHKPDRIKSPTQGKLMAATPINSRITSKPTDSTAKMLKIMRKQNEITEMLIKEQRLSTIPAKELTILNGDPLQYHTFIRTFEHCIESKTVSARDLLLFLDQYTDGQPRVLVQSCIHMPPAQGYTKAKKLLHRHYGSDILIASAYQRKVLNWQMLKSEDRVALWEYGLFLRSCANAMADVKALDDLNTTTHLRTIVSKLPFRLREKWRVVAFEYQERTKVRAKFKQLVNFIERRARMACDPAFGNIQDTAVSKPKDKRKSLAPKIKSG
ncbi:uncharacterized protein LOC130917851 [Corythoichthys intestinalis]|uniref:uncharacterized protein LOC130917851 n=1 Tax=Corythoichthys intestinalis TaxID=161448 RepID=UPI0025A4F416|nr:uncharacterized protein LOC130917851 [Corythoichthys intestinalis]